MQLCPAKLQFILILEGVARKLKIRENVLTVWRFDSLAGKHVEKVQDV